MKRFISILIIFSLIIPIGCSMVLAEAVSSIYSKTEIETLVREKLNLDSEMKLEYSNLQTQDPRQKKFWNLEFNSEKTNISVTVNAETGEITNFYRWGQDFHGKPVNILSDVAKSKAIAFIQSLEPDRFKETEEVTTEAPSMIIYDLQRNYYDSDNYHFLFVRKIEKEFFPNNYFKVQVSGATGGIIQYQMEWNEAIYDNNKPLISQEKARSFFEKEDRFQLRYVALNTNNKEERKIPLLTPVYLYTPKDSDTISAIDGRLFKREDIYGQWSDYARGMNLDDMGNMLSKESMTQEGGEIIPEEGALSKEKIEKIVIDALGKEIDLTDLKIQNSNYFNRYLGMKGKYWGIYLRDEGNEKTLHVMLDAEKGSILSVDFYKSSDNIAPVKNIVLTEKAMEEGIDTREVYEKELNKDNVIDIDEDKIKNEIFSKMQRIFPHIQGEEIKFQLAQALTDIGEKSLITVDSPRYIHDIPYDDNHLNVSYNINDGEILRLYYRWNDVEAQPVSKIIDKNTIEKKFYDTVGFEKYLTQLKDQNAAKNKGLDIPLKQLAPVYSLKTFNFAYIDGISGKFLNYNGEEYVEDASLQSEFKDLNAHPYQREINLMNKMGVLKERGKSFHPNDSLLRKDAIKWIVEMGWRRGVYSLDGYYEYYQKEESPFKDIDKSDPYYPYTIAAVKNGIIDEKLDYFKPEEKVKKLEVTKWIIKAMKQKELAEFTEIFQNPYADKDKVQDKDIGYVALAKYYNIYRDIEIKENFEPEEVLTRGEFVKALYNLMNRQ